MAYLYQMVSIQLYQIYANSNYFQRKYYLKITFRHCFKPIFVLISRNTKLYTYSTPLFQASMHSTLLQYNVTFSICFSEAISLMSL